MTWSAYNIPLRNNKHRPLNLETSRPARRFSNARVTLATREHAALPGASIEMADLGARGTQSSGRSRPDSPMAGFSSAVLRRHDFAGSFARFWQVCEFVYLCSIVSSVSKLTDCWRRARTRPITSASWASL